MTQLAKVFQNGRSQAICIPKKFRVYTTEVFIEKVGDTLVIRPTKMNKWDKFFDMLDEFDTSDFMLNREQPSLELMD